MHAQGKCSQNRGLAQSPSCCDLCYERLLNSAKLKFEISRDREGEEERARTICVEIYRMWVVPTYHIERGNYSQSHTRTHTQSVQHKGCASVALSWFLIRNIKSIQSICGLRRTTDTTRDSALLLWIHPAYTHTLVHTHITENIQWQSTNRILSYRMLYGIQFSA